MRFSGSEKMANIRIVESSRLSVKRMLRELDINRITFYSWYRRHHEGSYGSLGSRPPRRRQFWSAILPDVKQKIRHRIVANERPK
jgi:transposase-like protein